jgi:hypothetical protein
MVAGKMQGEWVQMNPGGSFAYRFVDDVAMNGSRVLPEPPCGARPPAGWGWGARRARTIWGGAGALFGGLAAPLEASHPQHQPEPTSPQLFPYFFWGHACPLPHPLPRSRPLPPALSPFAPAACASVLPAARGAAAPALTPPSARGGAAEDRRWQGVARGPREGGVAVAIRCSRSLLWRYAVAGPCGGGTL